MRLLPLVLLLTIGFVSLSQEIDSLEQVLKEETLDPNSRVKVLNQLGYEYWIVNPVQSVIYGQQARALANVIEDTVGLAFSNRVIGVANWAKGSYDDGLKYLFESLELYQSLNDSVGEANCRMNIGLIYADRVDYDRALTFYFDALKLFEDTKAVGRTGTTYTKIASIFIDQKKYDAASDFLKRAVKIHQTYAFSYGESEAYNRLGILKTAVGEYDSAYFYLNRSLEMSDQIGDLDGQIKTLVDLAKASLKQNDLRSTEKYLLDALPEARRIGAHKWLKEIYENLQVVNRRKGDLEKALLYYDQYILERDSIFNEETINNISRLEEQLANVETERQIKAREQQIVILQQDAALQRNGVILLTVGLLMVITFSALLITRRQALAKRRESEARAMAEKAQQEVEHKNRELSSYTVNFVQKNRLFEELIDSIQQIKKRSTSDVNKDLTSLEKTVKKNIQIDKDWQDFKLRFENVHQGFFDKLHEKFPALTNNDLRLSVLVKMNFSIKEIGDMFGISPESVKTARYRLKKKLNLPSEQNLNEFLNEIS